MTVLEWPKKMSAVQYRDRWYTDRTVKTVCNHIKKGMLPGIKDGGTWCVWVNIDDTPAYNYSAPPPPGVEPVVSSRAKELAQNIISQYRN